MFSMNVIGNSAPFCTQKEPMVRVCALSICTLEADLPRSRIKKGPGPLKIYMPLLGCWN